MKPLMVLKGELSVGDFALKLRSRGPIFWSEVEKFWVVTDPKLATEILKSESFSADRSQAFLQSIPKCPFHKVTNFFSVVKKMMVNSDAPAHTARRRLASFGINDHVLDRFVPQVERVVDQLVRAREREIRAGEIFDFVEDLAVPLPNIVLADLFCIPEEKRRAFYGWANAMTQFFGGASAEIETEAVSADEGASRLRAYFRELIAERRVHPREDFLSHLLKHQTSLGLDDEELVSQSAILLVAGTVTTTDQMANVMNDLISRQRVWADLGASPSAIEKAIEEGTRFDPAVSFIFRLTKERAALGDQVIEPGQLVFISTAAANHDPRKLPHLSYGHGAHYCLGARLARIQIATLLRALLKFGGDLEIVDRVRKNQSLGFSGFEKLTLRRKAKAL